MSVGMNKHTGRRLEGLDHLRQSIIDILATPLGSRVMRRDYGSRLFALTDVPVNRGGVMDVMIATAEALKKWEPRLQLSGLRIDVPNGDGRLLMAVAGIYTPDGSPISLDGLVI